jgi:hypothetical protein
MASNQITDSPPNQTAMQNQDGIIDPAWKAYFTQLFFVASCYQQSGITAKRPTKALYVGRTYFDSTLGKPIWYNGTIWVKSDGTAA